MNFKDNNVLELIGVSFERNGIPLVVMPFMANGDLLSYLKNSDNNLTLGRLLMFAIDIAKGMQYLSDQHFVHRDLAARNCVLDSDLTAKVADFGLSRDIYEKDYYRLKNKSCQLPVKWMAPESIESDIYTTKSDVWSYGVLLWELTKRGVTPYLDVELSCLLKHLKDGHRLAKPDDCPPQVYNVMTMCWSLDPKRRPRFKSLVNSLQLIEANLNDSERTKLVVKYGINNLDPDNYNDADNLIE